MYLSWSIEWRTAHRTCCCKRTGQQTGLPGWTGKLKNVYQTGITVGKYLHVSPMKLLTIFCDSYDLSMYGKH